MSFIFHKMLSLGLTVLISANNAGKTSFLDALSAAIGAGRRMLGPDDIRLASSEAMPPRDRQIIFDVRIRPIGGDGEITDKFPEGGFSPPHTRAGTIAKQIDDYP